MGLLNNKSGMVTGGGSGIGRATCLKFAEEGANVLVVDINEDDGLETVSLIESNDGKAVFAKADVGNEEDIANAVSKAQEAFGALHIASNNAALSAGSALLADSTAEDFSKTYQVTLHSVFYCMKYQIPAMVAAGGGAIVNIGSRAMMSAYDSAKAAVNGLTRSAAKEYAAQGIRVNCVNPGVVLTAGVEKFLATNEKHEARFKRGIAMNRLALPEELAEAVVWLCSDRSSYITGQSLNVDGGMLS